MKIRAMADETELPLRYVTLPIWAAAALSRPLELLNDHAHLEKKAGLTSTDVAQLDSSLK